MILVAAATSAATAWIATSYLFPKSLRPVTLEPDGTEALDAKLGRLDVGLRSGPKAATAPAGCSNPAGTARKGLRERSAFSEREIDALLAANAESSCRQGRDRPVAGPGQREDACFRSTRTCPCSAGRPSQRHGRPRAELPERPAPLSSFRGVSLWGVPIPNAWLGNLKNVDLVAYYGDEGFWHAFAGQSVNDIAVSDGRLAIELKE